MECLVVLNKIRCEKVKSHLFSPFPHVLERIYLHERNQPYWIGLHDRKHEGKFQWLDEVEEVSVQSIELFFSSKKTVKVKGDKHHTLRRLSKFHRLRTGTQHGNKSSKSCKDSSNNHKSNPLIKKVFIFYALLDSSTGKKSYLGARSTQQL